MTTIDRHMQTAAAAQPVEAPIRITEVRQTRARPGLVLGLVCAAQSIVSLDIAIVNVALPSIQRELALLLDCPEDAEGHVRDAIRLEDRMGARPFAAMRRLHLAEVLLARGGARRLIEAADLVGLALDAMRAVDMPGWMLTGEGVQGAIDRALTEGSALTRANATS